MESYYQYENGVVRYYVSVDEPVTSIKMEEWGNAFRDFSASLKHAAKSLAEFNGDARPMHLEYKRQRSRRVWRKYSK